ncbi:ADP-ribosylglycohydrolase family protein [Bailinhaonella thermotolerans]|uniref:ADP-ribosylglycohydrolase family protein n=1 Tax=Bailinhaonella thermotolerans TaxID=1070861 RepID=A0A3A4ABN7_9ACTN|nr:ADP-ribosylglycohydrolase family protein [Bailinhaonella thermotolerans]RJL22963.1 ADP-ribosylglycohydrolase family protein [Bailinhaonella thermotolerans]
MTPSRSRARGCLLGLAVGDALGRPAENLTPGQIEARWGRLTEIEPGGGTDDTEYTIFAASLLTRHGGALTPEDVVAAYREQILPYAGGPMKGAGFSERGAVQAMRRGFAPPLTGRWHPHGWSDGLAMRAAPYGIFATGNPAEAARLVAVDGSVSNAGEGVHGGAAVAAAVAVAMTGAPVDEVVAAGIDAVPADSWTGRNLRAVADGGDPAGVIAVHYPWTDLAPEAVALAFHAYLAGGGEVFESVTTAANLGRDADTTAAIAGALAGAGRGEEGVPERWRAEIGPASGKCLPAVAGRHVRDVADELVQAASRERG